MGRVWVLGCVWVCGCVFFSVQSLTQFLVAKTATPTPNMVVIAAAPSSANTLLSESLGTSVITVSRIAVDHEEPIAHNAPYTIAIRKEFIISPCSALS